MLYTIFKSPFLYYSVVLCLAASSSAALAGSSYILFSPRGNKIKSELVIKETPNPETQTPNYFAPKDGVPLHKLLIEEEMKETDKGSSPDQNPK